MKRDPMRDRVLAAAPFMSDRFDYPNGKHPLLSQLVEQSAVGCFQLDRKNVIDPATVGALALATERLVGALDRGGGHGRAMPSEEAWDARLRAFVLTRSSWCEATVPADTDVVFHHTVPLTVGSKPWIIHIENVTSLFAPDLMQGQTRGVVLYDQPIFHFIKHLLEDDNCRGIFTHMLSTVGALTEIFRSEVITNKIRFAPLGMHADHDEADLIRRSVEMKTGKQSGNLRLLFTNSWHQGIANFYLRGGLEVIHAFLEAQKTYPDITLTIRSAIPDEVAGSPIGRELENNPGIEVISEAVPERRIRELFRDADLFLLPSAALHSVSLLRAMRSGAACIVSDLPAFREFIEPDSNGILVPGRLEQVYTRDPESGWDQDDYGDVYSLNVPLMRAVSRAISDLCDDHGRRRRLGQAAAASVERNFRFERFRSTFDDMLLEAREPRAQPPSATDRPREFADLWLTAMRERIRPAVGPSASADAVLPHSPPRQPTEHEAGASMGQAARGLAALARAFRRAKPR
jgi:glycosyltransferase involved in cell wall biosynthesis